MVSNGSSSCVLIPKLVNQKKKSFLRSFFCSFFGLALKMELSKIVAPSLIPITLSYTRSPQIMQVSPI